MLINCSQGFLGSPETSSQILSQFFWFNKYIKVEDTAIHFPKFSSKDINFLSKLFEKAGSYYGSILKIETNWQMKCFFSGLNWVGNCFEKLFENATLNWCKIYLWPRLATTDIALQCFQYKLVITYFFSIKYYTFLE